MIIKLFIQNAEAGETFYLDAHKRFEVVPHQQTVTLDVRRISLWGPLLAGGASPTNMVLVDLELTRGNAQRRVARLRTDWHGDGLEIALAHRDAPVVDERSARYLLDSHRVLESRDFSIKKYIIRGVLDETRGREYVRRKLKKHFASETDMSLI